MTVKLEKPEGGRVQENEGKKEGSEGSRQEGRKEGGKEGEKEEGREAPSLQVFVLYQKET